MVEEQVSRWILSADAVVKDYGLTKVLRDANLNIASGEIHALLGGNGAGKSTLIRIVSGSTQPDGGTIRVNGETDFDRRAIAVVFQELALLPHLTVAENIVLPRHQRALARIRPDAAFDEAARALEQIDRDLTSHLEMPARDLDLHKRQLVEIARALSSGAKLVLLDEPTANLTFAETERLFEILRRLAAGGISILIVSHRMSEIRAIADVCTVLRDGRAVVERAKLADITDDEIVRAMMGDIRPAGKPPVRTTGDAFPSSKLALRLPSLNVQLAPGEILGLAGAPEGPIGLIETLIGERSRSPWSISLDREDLDFRDPSQAIKRGIGYVSGDRAEKGLLATLPILDNLVAAKRIAQHRWFVRSDEPDYALAALKRLSIKASSIDALPQSLSGGTQQKLLIARWLELDLQLLVLEEPTRGVDIGTKREIYDLIRMIAARGTIVIWWSTEFAELAEICSTVLAFDLRGNASSHLRGSDVTELRIAEATGMAA